jgi:glycosyltransferase involved in cell wall biosynthesis
MSGAPEVSIVILTKNEESRIARCLESVRWAGDIVVVDGLSTDRTVEICRRYGARVISRAFSGSFGEERNAGAEAAAHDWVLQLDGDDVVSDELREALCRLAREGSEHAAFQIRRKNNFLGRWMMRGGWYHYYPTLYRKSACRWEGRVHHRLKTDGTIGTLEAAVLHFPFENLEQFVAKQNRYTSLEAQEILDEQGVLEPRFVRYQLTWRPLKLFWKSYVKKQGFREGWHGLVFAILYAWVHFLKWAKYWELVRDRYQPAQRKEPSCAS